MKWFSQHKLKYSSSSALKSKNFNCCAIKTLVKTAGLNNQFRIVKCRTWIGREKDLKSYFPAWKDKLPGLKYATPSDNVEKVYERFKQGCKNKQYLRKFYMCRSTCSNNFLLTSKFW